MEEHEKDKNERGTKGTQMEERERVGLGFVHEILSDKKTNEKEIMQN